MTDRRLVTIVGATGTQGGSTINHLLEGAPGEYDVRAVTRNPESEAAKSLADRGVEIVNANLDDLSLLIAAFKGSYAIFAVTDFWTMFNYMEKDETVARETQQGKNMADAAEATMSSLHHYIWSTLADTERISGGHRSVPHYESKATVNSYIESKPELFTKTTFLWCSYYATNFSRGCLKPVLIPSAGKYVQLQSVPEDTPMAFMGNTRANLGAFVKAILEQPSKVRNGKTVFAYIERTTLGCLLQAWAKAHGVEAQYVQIPTEAYFALFPKQAEEMHIGMEFWDYARNKNWASKHGLLTYHELGIDISKLLSSNDSLGLLSLE